MATSKKAQYAPPASQVDLEERLANGNKSDRVLSTADSFDQTDDGAGRDFRVEGNDTDGYVGTSPEYATYANDTEAPLQSDDEDDNPENQVFREFAESPVPATLKVEGNVEYEGQLAAAKAAREASEAARAKREDTDDKSEPEEEKEEETPSTPPAPAGQSS